MTKVYVIMGVSGCGKSTVGQALAVRLGCPFYDGDDFHPAANVAKMAGGAPLNDEDRAPWLAVLHELLARHVEKGETAVLACSALKKAYRDQLRAGQQDDVAFVYLQGSFDLIWQRMAARPNHYMKAAMLQSQFDTLEEPDDKEAIRINISESINAIVETIFA